MRRFVGTVLFVCAAFAACHGTTQTQENAEVVDSLCNCLDPGNADCVSQLTTAVGSASPQCVECVFDNERACAAMENECPTLCFPQQQP